MEEKPPDARDRPRPLRALVIPGIELGGTEGIARIVGEVLEGDGFAGAVEPAAKEGPESKLGASSAGEAALPLRRLIIALGLFSAVSAIGGGIELLVWRAGNEFLPLELIAHTPFT